MCCGFMLKSSGVQQRIESAATTDRFLVTRRTIHTKYGVRRPNWRVLQRINIHILHNYAYIGIASLR